MFFCFFFACVCVCVWFGFFVGGFVLCFWYVCVWVGSFIDSFFSLENSIHNLGLVGHIEDIVVNKDQQGKKLGLRIIEALDYIAEKVGCYKVSSPCISVLPLPTLFSRISNYPRAE